MPTKLIPWLVPSLLSLMFCAFAHTADISAPTFSIIARLETNWITISHTSPAILPSAANYAVYRPTLANQVGIVVTNFMAHVVWKGRTNEFLIETVDADCPVMRRSVEENTLSPWSNTRNNVMTFETK